MTIARRLGDRLDRPYSLALVRIVSAGLSVISALLLSRALGPAGRGEAAAAIAIVSLMPIVLGLGVPLVVRRQAAFDDGIERLVRTVRFFAGLLVLPSAVIGLAVAFTVLQSLDTPARLVFVLSASSSPIAFLWLCNANLFIAQGRSGVFALTNLIPVVFYVALVVAGHFLGALSVSFAISANWMGSVATLIFTTLMARVGLRGSRHKLGSTVSEGVKYSGGQIAEAASYRLDQAMALPLAGAFQAGLYSVAAMASLIPLALGQALGTASFRLIATAPREEQRNEAIIQLLRSATFFSLAMAGAMAIATPVFVPTVFGAEFVGAVIPTLIALGGSVPLVIAYVGSTALTALGRSWALTVTQLSGVLVNVLALVILAPRYGAIGLAAASAVGYFIGALVCLRSLPVRSVECVPGVADLRPSMNLLLRRTSP
ncbi:lipopolysaccharide biosynthesis protein [Ilumatobacter sp.]|uniref:lipopolysaccharide biosynthesis protein n=1 Tax=Ilumatobacter sp. TaxID=1967498 RepID=UPI003752080F